MQTQILLSALSVGVSLGALGLSSWLGRNGDKLCEEQIEQELLRLVIDGKECKETFQQFPFYLSETTRESLKSVASVHFLFCKHTRDLSPADRAILICGREEFYIQTLVKALAHHFESKLLLLDVVDFSFKILNKYGCTRKEPPSKMSVSEASKRVFGWVGSFSVFSSNGKTKGTSQENSNATGSPNVTSKLNENTASQSAPRNSAPLKQESGLFEKLFMQLLYKVLISASEKSFIILYIRDADKLFLQSEQLYDSLHEMLGKLTGPVLVLGSKIADEINKPDLPPGIVPSQLKDICSEADERLAVLFPYSIKIEQPEDESDLEDWKAQPKKNKKTIKSQDNRNHIAEVLATNDVECKDLNSISHEDTKILSTYIEEIAVSATSYYLTNTNDPEYRNGKLVISSESLCHALDLFREKKSSDNGKKKPETNGKKEVCPDNQHEKNIRSELIPANEIGVTFSDIGALEEIKESLQELVVLPFRRPKLFKSGLLKPCRGILLVGPSGTGKTMLAKATVNEAGASFINVSMSTITSKWVGETEKYVQALFTVAAKVSPTVIFIDEADSLLGERVRPREHEAARRFKNEFMTHWDGLLTKQHERILVLAATNRPFDLDDAIIGRFERRIMVGLPSVEAREIILKTILAKENTENLDFEEIAVMTEGYTGSDLKNLCTTAAYRLVRELIKREKLMDTGKNKTADKGQSLEVSSSAKKDIEEPVITLRPINMEDMIQAKKQVPASSDAQGLTMRLLKQWNEVYGERVSL